VENDRVTELLGRWLMRPVQLCLERDYPDWKLVVRRGSLATKDGLRRLLGGGETPGLLLLSSHGRRIDPDFPEHQRMYQGSPVCEPSENGDGLFTVEDLPEPKGSDLRGLITFLFGCYTAGTPALNNFPHEVPGRGPEAALSTEPHVLSKKPFMARLPVELLRRGALAVVGHVDRAWTTSCLWASEQQDLNTTASLEDSLSMLHAGHRLGQALRPLHRRYTHLASRVAQMLDVHRTGVELDLARLGFYWTALNDARNVVIVGDPAVYLLGRRSASGMIQLDPALLRRIERRIRGPHENVERFVHRILDEHV
jgi:hypothetical protein